MIASLENSFVQNLHISKEAYDSSKNFKGPSTQLHEKSTADSVASGKPHLDSPEKPQMTIAEEAYSKPLSPSSSAVIFSSAAILSSSSLSKDTTSKKEAYVPRLAFLLPEKEDFEDFDISSDILQSQKRDDPILESLKKPKQPEVASSKKTLSSKPRHILRQLPSDTTQPRTSKPEQPVEDETTIKKSKKRTFPFER